MRVAIVDDTPEDALRLEENLERFSCRTGVELTPVRFADGQQFIQAGQEQFDLVIMDIDMPGMDGMQAARLLRQSDPEVPLMFVTNMPQYALAGYEVDAIDYVLKPVEFGDFDLKLQKALHRYLKGDLSGDTEYDALVREYFANGGPVAYTMLADYQSIKSDLDTLAGDEKKAKEVAKTVLNWMTVQAKHSELLSRIATYALYRGTIPDLSIGIQASVTEAIWQSKEVTVNFDKRGEWSRYFGVAELFFNAGRQSNRNHLNLIRNHPVRYLAASAVMGAIKATIQGLLASVSSMLFGGDGEPEDARKEYLDKYFSINRFTRYSNFCLVLGDKIVKIPVSPSFMPLSIMAEIAAEMIYTDFTKERALTMTADLAVAAAQLVGGECLGAVVGAIAHDSPGELTKAIPFALMQPVLELSANRNWLGNKIMRDDKWVEGLAAHTRAYSNVEDYYMTVAQAINRLGGGDDEGEPGRLNNLLANPAAYKHLIESYLGGIGSFVFDSFSTASLLAQGKYDRALRESPAKRFLADAASYREQEAWEAYYTARERLTHAQDMRRRYTRSGNARKALSAEIEEVKLKRGIEQAERMLDTLNDAMQAEITANPRDARDIRKRYRARQAKYLRKLLPLPHAE